MQFSTCTAFLALIGSALAQTANFDAITTPTKGQELVADGKQSYKITWDPTPEYNGQDVSILLLQGASQDTLDFYPGAKVASSIDSALGSYTWTPDSSIAGYATYGLKLQLDSDTTIFQYSFPFKITAGGASTKTLPVTTTSSSSSSSIVSTAAPLSSQQSSASVSAATTTTTTSSSEGSATTVTTAVSASGASGTSTATGNGSGAQTTLTTAVKPSSTGSAAGSSTPTVVTAGAGRAVAGGFAAIGGVMVAVLAL